MPTSEPGLLAGMAVTLASVGRQLEREGNPAAETIHFLAQEAAKANRENGSGFTLSTEERGVLLRLLDSYLRIDMQSMREADARTLGEIRDRLEAASGGRPRSKP